MTAGLEPLTRVPGLPDFPVQQDYVTPQQFAPAGAIVGDGTERALSTIFSTLGEAQAVFPFITALTQTIDYACIKAMSNRALGSDQTESVITYTDQPTSGSTASLINDTTKSWTVNEHTGKTLYLRYPNGFVGTATIASNTATALTLSPPLPYGDFMLAGSACGYLALGPPQIYDCVAYGIGSSGEHGEADARLNKVMFIPAGRYMLGSDKWLIRNVSGAKIIGAGRRSTNIVGSGIVFATDGLWFSQIEGVGFESTGSPAVVVDIDGNVPGHPYATRGVQGNTFKDLYVASPTGTPSTYLMAVTRLGNPPSGSGAQGSENLWLNCHFLNSTTASLFSTGFNALQNTIIGGNFQGHQKHAIQFDAGSFYIFSTGFQSTHAYAQITNDGYDINSNFGGVGERIAIIGCRTESIRFFRGSGSQPATLISNNQNIAGDVGWTASSPYAVSQINVKNSVSGRSKLYRVTTAGTSAGAEPTWPNSGTVSDGSVVWTTTEFLVVDAGIATLINNGWQAGNVRCSEVAGLPLGIGKTTEVSANYTASVDDETLLVDASAGNITQPFHAMSRPTSELKV